MNTCPTRTMNSVQIGLLSPFWLMNMTELRRLARGPRMMRASPIGPPGNRWYKMNVIAHTPMTTMTAWITLRAR